MIKHLPVHSFLKALSWRLCATIITMLITYIITRKISFAVSIGVMEFLSKIVLFYMHERLWENLIARSRTQ